MGYTVALAEAELQKIIDGKLPATKEELQKIINGLDVTDTKAASDAKTILYSGMDKTTIANLTQDANNRMLNNTAAFEFLDEIKNNPTFAKAWFKVTGNLPDWKGDYTGEVDKFIGGIDGNPQNKKQKTGVR